MNLVDRSGSETTEGAFSLAGQIAALTAAFSHPNPWVVVTGLVVYGAIVCTYIHRRAGVKEAIALSQ
jgi:hypothetical protein